MVAETRFAGPIAIAHREGLSLIELVGARKSGSVGTSHVLGELLESLEVEGVELVGCQAGPARIRLLVDGPVPEGIPDALRRQADILAQRACVAVIGRDLESDGDTVTRLLATARRLDEGATGWVDGSVACALVAEDVVAEVVRAAYGEFFGSGRLDESPAVG